MSKMTNEEMIKRGFELMIKNNPDEAVKVLIMYDKEIKEIKEILGTNNKYDYELLQEIENIVYKVVGDEDNE